MNTENWKYIDGSDSCEISDLGRVRKTTIFSKSGAKLKILKQFKRADGYITVTIKRKDGNSSSVKVHLLVANAFLVKPDSDELEINHIDLNRENNAASNLEWLSPQKNQQHASEMRRMLRKRRMGYSDSDIILMRKCKDIGLSLSQIGRAFTIDAPYLSRILRGIRRKE